MNRIDSMDQPVGRRDLLRSAAVVIVSASAGAITSVHAGTVVAATPSDTSATRGIRAFKLYTGSDNASHMLEGTIAPT